MATSQPIPNPYVIVQSPIGRSWLVLFRYTIGGKIQFNHICECGGKRGRDTALRIAKLLNADYASMREAA